MAPPTVNGTPVPLCVYMYPHPLSCTKRVRGHRECMSRWQYLVNGFVDVRPVLGFARPGHSSHGVRFITCGIARARVLFETIAPVVLVNERYGYARSRSSLITAWHALKTTYWGSSMRGLDVERAGITRPMHSVTVSLKVSFDAKPIPHLKPHLMPAIELWLLCTSAVVNELCSLSCTY